MSDKVLGSVMVVGGGIAGMQASLDLANAGYFVHLVEKSPAIGGTMAQIDKTFPQERRQVQVGDTYALVQVVPGRGEVTLTDGNK